MAELNPAQQAALEDATPKGTPDFDVSAASAFKNRFKTNTYRLQDGLVIKYRALLPIDWQSFRGAALSAQMIADGFTLNETQDMAKREEHAASLPRIMRAELMVEAAREAVIHACLSPKFTALPPEDCPDDKVSIDDALSPTEILLLNDEIYRFSGGSLEDEIFQEAGETNGVEGQSEADANGTGEHADDSLDSEGVQAESV